MADLICLLRCVETVEHAGLGTHCSFVLVLIVSIGRRHEVTVERMNHHLIIHIWNVTLATHLSVVDWS